MPVVKLFFGVSLPSNHNTNGNETGTLRSARFV